MKINESVFVLRAAITKIVPLLSGRDIPVHLRGMTASVAYDPRTGQPCRVNLPYLPDDASQELVDAVHGFLDHEVSHILHSEFEALEKANKEGGQVPFLQNALEDPMIEGKMARAFTGSQYNLSNTARFFLSEMVDPKLKLAMQSGDAAEIAAILTVPAFRAWAGQADFIHYMRDKWHLVDELKGEIGQDLVDEIAKCETSFDTLELAKRISKRLKNQDEPPPPEEEEEEGGGEPGEAGSEKGEKPNAGNSGEGEDEGSASASGPGDGESDAEDAPGEGNIRPQENSDFAEQFQAALASQQNYDEALASALTARAIDDARKSDYLIFTRDDDLIDFMPITTAATNAIPDMHEAVDEMLGPMAKDIERMMAARSAIVWTGGHKRGRLHSSALMRTQFDRVDVFQRRQTNTSKSVAVQLIVDCSGSMSAGGMKLRTACYSAFALASVLERVGIPCEVLGFTTRAHSGPVRDQLRADPMYKEYARWEALYIPIFKAFNERLGVDVKSRFTYPISASGLCASNVDGESILLGSRRLLARREARKVMLVLSDGQPAVHGAGNLSAHLKAAVKSIAAHGVDIVGIGIQDQSVKHYYPKCVVMNSVAELPGIVMGELKRALVA